MEETRLLNQRYLLEKTLGMGGMAVVYSARDLTLERNVAVKVLREDFSADPAFRLRFHDEAKAAANLTHPSIVTVHDFGLDNEKLFIVMESVPGADLKSILARRGRLPVSEAVSLMIQACAGVGYAHRAGLVHCDIKPQNLLVTPDRRLKVTDFGIARALASITPGEHASIVWGSPQYFAPEQAAGEAPCPASDVYSLGIVFYEMITGQLPFMGSSPAELAHLHRDVAPIAPSRLNPEIPASLDQIVMKVLAKEPSARYRTADQFGRVLMSFLHPSQPVSVQPQAQYAPAPPVQRPAATVPQPYPQDTQPEYYEPEPDDEPLPNPLDIDWGTWALALLALIAVGGLIPFFLWVYFTYNPPFM